MVAAMSALKMLHAFREAEVIAARIGASKMGILTTPSGDDFVGEGYENDFQPVIDVEPGSFHRLAARFGFKCSTQNIRIQDMRSLKTRCCAAWRPVWRVSYASLSNSCRQ